MVSVSAPGKIHLIGEHAVVYGYPAILCAINKRLKITLEKSKKVKILVKRGNNLLSQPSDKWREKISSVEKCKETAKKSAHLWNKGDKEGNFTPLLKFLKKSFWRRLEAFIGFLLINFKIKKGLFLKIESEINSGMGLGSSAALSVALVNGISLLYDIKLSKNKINKIAYEIEKLSHGRPSGGDNAISTFGGLLLFGKGTFEKLKTPCFLENLVIALTKRRGSTGELIQKVKNLDKKLKKSLLKDIGENANKLKTAIKNEDFENFKKIINETQDDLTKLQVSTPKIDRIVKEIRKNGGAAKLSGAGGGGAILCFHSDKKKLTAVLKKLNIPFFETKIDNEGAN